MLLDHLPEPQIDMYGGRKYLTAEEHEILEYILDLKFRISVDSVSIQEILEETALRAIDLKKLINFIRDDIAESEEQRCRDIADGDELDIEVDDCVEGDIAGFLQDIAEELSNYLEQ